VAIGVGQSIARHYGTSRSWGGLSEIFFPWLVKITRVRWIFATESILHMCIIGQVVWRSALCSEVHEVLKQMGKFHC
jgi:hypothetical protein